MSYEKLNAMQIITAGSDDDCVALAPAGTKAPTTLAIPATFKEVGWIDKDGIEFTAHDSVDKRRAHQGNRVYKVQMTESDSGVTFTALQSNIDTLKLQWLVKASSEDSGVIKHVLSSSRKVENVAIIVTSTCGTASRSRSVSVRDSSSRTPTTSPTRSPEHSPVTSRC